MALTFFACACHALRAGQNLQKNRFQKFCPKIGAGALLNMQPGMASASGHAHKYFYSRISWFVIMIKIKIKIDNTTDIS